MKESDNTLIRSIAIAMLATATGTAPAFSQITAATTFGPGDSHDPIPWIVGATPEFNQSIAQGFVCGGPNGYFLSQLRLALTAAGSPYTISFLAGADLNAATTLES